MRIQVFCEAVCQGGESRLVQVWRIRLGPIAGGHPAIEAGAQ